MHTMNFWKYYHQYFTDSSCDFMPTHIQQGIWKISGGGWMGVSHHRFHPEIFFLCDCACPFPLYHDFYNILERVEDWVWWRQTVRQLELMWQSPIVHHGTWHMTHNYSQKIKIFDIHATPMTEAHWRPNCSYPSIHTLSKTSFWLNIAKVTSTTLLNNFLH